MGEGGKKNTGFFEKNGGEATWWEGWGGKGRWVEPLPKKKKNRKEGLWWGKARGGGGNACGKRESKNFKFVDRQLEAHVGRSAFEGSSDRNGGEKQKAILWDTK